MNQDSEQTGPSETPDEIFPSLKSLQRLAISESGFVFDPVTGHNFTSNETALALLRLLQKTTELDTVLSQLEKKYKGDRQELERDVREFGSLLKDYVTE